MKYIVTAPGGAGTRAVTALLVDGPLTWAAYQSGAADDLFDATLYGTEYDGYTGDLPDVQEQRWAAESLAALENLVYLANRGIEAVLAEQGLEAQLAEALAERAKADEQSVRAADEGDDEANESATHHYLRGEELA